MDRDKLKVALENLFDEDDFKIEYGNAKAGSQYNGLKWLRLELSDKIKTKLKDEYKEVLALHVMPYRINVNDVECAISKDDLKTKQEKYGYTKFNEIIKENSDFVDYDPETGNIHKNVNYDYQIVCVMNKKHYGPKWKKDPNNKLELENIKTNWYYPKIDERKENLCKNFTEDDIIKYVNKLINDVLDEILEK